MSPVRGTSGQLTNEATLKLQKPYFPDTGPKEMGYSVAVSNHNSSIPVNVVGKLSQVRQSRNRNTNSTVVNSEDPFTGETVELVEAQRLLL